MYSDKMRVHHKRSLLLINGRQHLQQIDLYRGIDIHNLNHSHSQY